MTERTVEVEVTTTEAAPINICDDCGLEVEPDADDGVTFLPVTSADALDEKKGEVDSVAYREMAYELQETLDGMDLLTVEEDTDHEPIHFHEDCLDRILIREGDGQRPTAPPTRLTDDDGLRIVIAMASAEISVGLIGLGLVGASYALGSGPFRLLGTILGGMVVLLAVYVGVQQASDPEKYIRVER